MSIKDQTSSAQSTRIPVTTEQEVPPQVPAQQSRPTRIAPWAGQALAVLRIVMGLTFLWAFLDKTFGFGYSTTSAQAWINGGSPTKGFLAHVEVGPMASVLRSWAGAPWADWLFMIGLLGLGLALLLGIGMRISAVAGTVLLAFMWIAEWPLAQHTAAGAATASTNPIIDYHIVYLVVVIALAALAAGETWGLGRWWNKLDLVQRYPWLR